MRWACKATSVRGTRWGSYGGDRNLREWRKFLDEASGMGLDLLITEFDVNDRKLPADIVKRAMRAWRRWRRITWT
jgi:GH35 family endo-1,4-beta-xylanase